MPANTGKPAFPAGVPLDQDNFNRWVVNQIENLQAALIPPSMVSNFRVTPAAGSNIIDFTRSDGDAYTLYINSTASVNGATRIDLGIANRYTDDLGQGSIKRYYAVKAKKGNVGGTLSGWVSGTTLALGTPITTPTPPAATQFPFTDQETDSTQVAIPSGVQYFPV